MKVREKRTRETKKGFLFQLAFESTIDTKIGNICTFIRHAMVWSSMAWRGAGDSQEEAEAASKSKSTSGWAFRVTDLGLSLVRMPPTYITLHV